MGMQTEERRARRTCSDDSRERIMNQRECKIDAAIVGGQ